MRSLEVYGLTKRFKKTLALKNVTFSLNPGESLAILGPAGSGKTTLARLIVGLEEPDEGQIVLNGKDITFVPASQRYICLVGNNAYGLLAHMSVFENISMPLQPHFSGKEIKEGMGKQRILSVAQYVHIQHLLERKVGTLSAGERLRVAIARGLVKKPLLSIFDESLMQLDTPTRLAARREILELHQTIQLPFLYMTRDQPEAFALADRIVVINEGEIQQIGSRADLFFEPATLWVAQWLGFPPMNTLIGSLQSTFKEDGLHFRVWSKSISPLLPLQWTAMLERTHCQNIIIGIRPEDIIPEWELREKWTPLLYTLVVKILASEWHQGNTLVQFQLPHSEEPFMAVFEASSDQLKIGQAITVGFDPEKFCLFHPDTQRLLHAPPVLPGIRRNFNHLRAGFFLKDFLKNYQGKNPY